MITNRTKPYAGLDVSKKVLELAVHESDYRRCYPNKASAFAELIAELLTLEPARIVVELPVNLPHPRDPLSAEFTDLRSQCVRWLHAPSAAMPESQAAT